MDSNFNHSDIQNFKNSSNLPENERHVTFEMQLLFTLVYITGVIGNILALFILFHKDKVYIFHGMPHIHRTYFQRRNRKHLLMLRCLATNDLVALLGMLLQMYVTIYVKLVTATRVFCSLRIVWRFFGLFSGCVAIVMAAERWLALTKPFTYQKVTFPVIVRYLLVLWIFAFGLTSLPLFGFGIYYDGNKCVRYRNATKTMDVAYAYLWLFFGSVLCICIVWCNLAVWRALTRLGRRNGALRRISRASFKLKSFSESSSKLSEVGLTIEERAFARLMAVLSITFVICWMPQMISILLAQYQLRLSKSDEFARKMILAFQKVADLLLCVHFTLDPYIYVLLRMPRPRFTILTSISNCCRSKRKEHSYKGVSTDNPLSSGDSHTPITEAPSTHVSEEVVTQLVTNVI